MRTLFLLWLLISPAAASELKLASWTLSWLTTRPAGDPDLPANVQPKRAEDIATLQHYAVLLNADVVAFSAVDGPEIAAQVFPPDRYAIHITSDHSALRSGFAIRRGLEFTANPDLAALDVTAPSKYHLRSAADVTLHLTSGPLRLLSVDLKAGCAQAPLGADATPSCQTLGRQLPVLQSWMTARAADGGSFALLGNFNRWMTGHDPFIAGLQQTAPLTQSDQGLHSQCWGGGGFLDHILLGGAAREMWKPNSLRVLVYSETGAEMRKRLSSHCPISVRLELP